MEPLKDFIRIVFGLREDHEINNMVAYIFCVVATVVVGTFVMWSLDLFKIGFF